MPAKKDPITRPDSPAVILPQIPKDAWRPCKPIYTSTPQARAAVAQQAASIVEQAAAQGMCPDLLVVYEPSRALYKLALEQFRVETAGRYQPIAHYAAPSATPASPTTPTPPPTTTASPGPQTAPRQTTGHTTFCNIYVQDVASSMGVPLPLRLANDMLGFLQANAVPCWHVGTKHDTVQAAQRGHPALVGWVNPTGGPGHIVMVRPESSLATDGPVCIAQAGAVCFSMGPLVDGFSLKRVPLIWAWAD